MKQNMSKFLESLFYSKNNQIKEQAKIVYAELTLFNEINQALTRFNNKKPKFSDLKIGFNNYKLAEQKIRQSIIFGLARLNSLLANNKTENLFEQTANPKESFNQQLNSVTTKINAYFICNNINQEQFFNQGVKQIS